MRPFGIPPLVMNILHVSVLLTVSSSSGSGLMRTLLGSPLGATRSLLHGLSNLHDHASLAEWWWLYQGPAGAAPPPPIREPPAIDLSTTWGRRQWEASVRRRLPRLLRNSPATKWLRADTGEGGGRMMTAEELMHMLSESPSR